MSSRFLLGIVLFLALAIASTFFVLSISFVRTEIGALLPLDVALEIDGPLRSLLVGQAVALFILSLLLTAAIFAAFSMLIARPLRRLAHAMDTYGTTGERKNIEGILDAPKEIQSLAVSFDTLISRVEDSHKRDTEVSRVKSDFISTAAHQLRTPLTGIRWAHEALLNENLTENQKVLVQSAVDKSKDLVAIVGTLLDISAIESGKYKYDMKPADLHPLLEEIARDFAPLAAQTNVTLYFDSAGSQMVPPVLVDKERIKWVLNNLVENAIVYTPGGGTVKLSIDGSERRIFIRVKDSGIGIDDKDRANIFERFFRAGNAITKQQKGNGLGLYIARTIATDHGGDLSFAPNKEGPGTTFILSLPVA